MFIARELHDLHRGDYFSFEQGGPVFVVDDADFIDSHQAGVQFEERLIMYRAQDGLHAHQAGHGVVWLFIAE
jgi:hypothetical protein